MSKHKMGLNTICIHSGDFNSNYKEAVSPLHVATAYSFQEVEVKRYPRYFNTPNQEALAKKIAALEKTEAALIFGSGMAAISTTLLSFLQKGEHILFQKTIYGGTLNMVREQFNKFGIEYSFTDGHKPEDFKNKIKENTKILYIETPSNPLLEITDIKEIVKIAKKYHLITIIDNTFASSVNQTPFTLGVDIVIHSATKYFGGHSDILAGAVAASKNHIDIIASAGKNFGGNLSEFTVWLLERSIKTLGLRVKTQNRNAKKIAKYLNKHPDIFKVYYPGLKSHPDHHIAKSQMKGFGGMLSLELKEGIDASLFLKELQFIKPAMSLGGVESTILFPALTSHALLTPSERQQRGISDSLLRLSVGIENVNDLIDDIEQALNKVRSKRLKLS